MAASVAEFFERVVSDDPDGAAFRHKIDGEWTDVSWRRARDDVRAISRALIAAGVKRGDRVAILGETTLDWVLIDLAIALCGAATVGIYQSNLGPDCAYILKHSGSVILFVDGPQQLEKIRAVRGELPALRAIIAPDPGTDLQPGELERRRFLDAGESTAAEQLDERSAEIEADDVASLVYTSGTTGVPKAAMITHRNILFSVESSSDCLDLNPGDTALLFLPLAHVFARLIVYLCMGNRTTIAFSEGIQQVVDNMQEVDPHFVPSPPRLFEKAQDRIVGRVRSAGWVRRKLFYWGLDVGMRISNYRQEQQQPPMLLRGQHRLADRLVLSKIRAVFGRRFHFAVSGAAPLSPTVTRFFDACGVVILEGIGMTENTSFSHVNRLGANRIGTVGQPGPGVEQRLAQDGEVLLRAPNVMKGYYDDPEATAEAIDADGWLHTGDIGEIDSDGFLRITDRKKDLIVTAGGKNVAPQRIERALRASPYISQAVAYGDRKKYLTALIALDADNVAGWAGRNGVTGDRDRWAADDRIRELVEREVARSNSQLASFETIKRFHILPQELSIAAGELTPTLKVKRKVVYARHAEALEALYETTPA